MYNSKHSANSETQTNRVNNMLRNSSAGDHDVHAKPTAEAGIGDNSVIPKETSNTGFGDGNVNGRPT